MPDRITFMLRAIDDATNGTLYEALDQCKALGCTPTFFVEVLHEASTGDETPLPASPVEAEGSTPEEGRPVRSCLAAAKDGRTLRDWGWRIQASQWEAYRAAIELGVTSTINRVRRGLQKFRQRHDKFWQADPVER